MKVWIYKGEATLKEQAEQVQRRRDGGDRGGRSGRGRGGRGGRGRTASTGTPQGAQPEGAAAAPATETQKQEG
ncbi:hypothetical protein GCM10029992_64810 [Glycomyces albus]